MKRLQALLPHLPIIPYVMIYADGQLKFDEVGPSVTAILGHTPEGFLSREPIHPDDRERRASALMRCSQPIVEGEFRFQHSDGKYLWFEDKARIVCDGPGQLRYIVGSLTDITARKQTERELAHTRQRFHHALTSGSITLSEQDESLRYRWFFNPQGGLNEAQIVGKTASQIVNSDDARKADALKRHVMDTGEPASEAFMFTLPDGNTRVVELKSSPLHDEDGHVRGVTTVSYDITALHTLKEQLRRNEHYVDLMLKGSGVAMFIIERDGRYTWVKNPAAAPPERIIGKDVWDFAPPDVAQQMDDARQLVHQTGQTHTMELDFHAEDGETFIYHVRVEPVFDEDGHVAQTAVISIDVTERTRQKKLYQLLATNGHDMIALHQADGTYQYISPACIHLLGYAPEHLVGRSPYAFIHPEDVEQVRQSMQKASQAVTRPVEYRMRHRAGYYIWLQTLVQPVIGRQGELTAITTSSREITEQRRLREQLREQKTFVETVLNTIEHRIAVVNAAGDIITVNRAWAEYGEANGADPAKISTGTNYITVCQQAIDSGAMDVEPLLSGLLSVLSGDRETYKTLYSFATPQGHTEYHQMTVLGLHNANDQFMIIHHDVTNLKQAEAELKNRTEELAESNAELEQFAYVASHDLQEPLRAVSGYLNLLKQLYTTDLDPEAVDFVSEAISGAERMRELINGLLAYSRVNRKTNPFEPTPLKEVAEDACANLQRAITEANAEITIGSLPTLPIDPIQITRVFQNLISNAVKFGGEPPALVHIEAEEHPTHWHISVSDNGIGIDPQYHERIFTIFQRLHTRDEIPGTGMGLALVRKIVSRHGGDIWIDSDGETGTTVTFSLAKAPA
jgi:PAS domain S-box-containing protein